MPIITGGSYHYHHSSVQPPVPSIMNGGNNVGTGTVIGSNMTGLTQLDLNQMHPHSDGMGGVSVHRSGGGLGGGSRKRHHDGKELIYLTKKKLKFQKEMLIDPLSSYLFISQSDINILESCSLKRRSSSLQQFLINHSYRDPDEIITKIENEAKAIKEKQKQLPEIKLAGGIPVATSTTLPPAVARLSQQQGGTPLDPSSEKLHNKFGRIDQDQIAEKAKQEAYVLQRVSQLQREGLWFEKRLPKVAEPTRTKAHWDYLLEEMQWLATDFAQERKWKKAMAKKIARSVQKYFQEKKQLSVKAEKAAEQNARKTASFMARGVKQFWNNVGKMVEFKQTTIIEEKRKQALDLHLSFIVGETEKFSTLVAESMNKPASVDDQESSHTQSDGDFQPEGDSSDDEETIEKEETQIKNRDQEKEIELLRKETEMSLDDILDQLPPGYWEQRAKDLETEHEQGGASTSKDDSDFTAEEDTSDDEETLEEQEKAEGDIVDHEAEVAELEADNELSIEQLRAKYAGGAGGGGMETPPVDDEDVEMESVDEDDQDDDSEADDIDDDDDLSGSDDSDNEDDLVKMAIDDTKDHELSSLLKDPTDDTVSTAPVETDAADKKMNDVAALAESIQPKGYTLSSTSVVTPVPFLLQFPLREYQHVGLDWLVTMFDRNLNGILADEMGLGKTIQTIALLAHLACEKSNWGPHLIVVPTSVMLNWEMEIKKWCPAFKVLTYYGTIKERRLKRQGWTKPNTFHVCITSYKLVIQDHQSFRRKKWHYLILDEAQNIKNFKSQRWQLLLNFNTDRRLLLTGTPLQNNLNELWSLMHFLMPSLFQSHNEFQAWFSMPMKDMIEGNSDYNENIIKRLHKVLRPFLLRRLKCEVEKQLPRKYEHVVMCRLSNRQKYLYDDFMSRTKTKETLANGTMLSVINILMQLRKVCNHPNLFEERATISPFHMDSLLYEMSSCIFNALEYDVSKHVSLEYLNLNLLWNEIHISLSEGLNIQRLKAASQIIENIDTAPAPCPSMPKGKPKLRVRCKDPKGTVRVVIVNNSTTNNVRVHKTEAMNIGNVLLRQEVCGGGVLGLSPRLSTPINNTQGPVIPIPFGKIKIIGNPSRVLVNKSGQVLTSLIKLPTVISQASSNATSMSVVTSSFSTHPQQQTVMFTPSRPSAIIPTTIMSATTSMSSSSSTSAGTTVASPAAAVVATTTSSSTISSSAVKSEDNSVAVASLRRKRKSDPIIPETESSPGLFTKADLEEKRRQRRVEKLKRLARINEARCAAPHMLYGDEVRNACHVISRINEDLTVSYEQRVVQLEDMFKNFLVYVPSVTAPLVQLRVSHPHPSTWNRLQTMESEMSHHLMPKLRLLHPVTSALCTQFPDPRLIQYDCGKLQSMDVILRELKVGGHRVLIFTQMTRMLDVLEAFLNFHGHIYLRLDGTTKVEQRQLLMERFNNDPRIFCFILSTRSGGVGVNLTGADTVIFYDSDWNPTMDAQAQDRCHRIGQTRDVHIYRLISEKTIEENILKKANQKRLLGDLAIEGGNFTTAYFKSSTIQDLFNVDKNENDATKRMADVLEPTAQLDKTSVGVLENAFAAAEDATDVAAAKCAKAELVADLAEFDENIPVTENSHELSKAEQEVNALMEQLSSVERWAIGFYESKLVTAELVAQAEAELEQQKKEWELERLATSKREEQRRRELKVESQSELFTFSREDAKNQVWIGFDNTELMPLWSPPTPPQDDNDIYIDYSLMMLYESETLPESQLPIIIKKDKKRVRADVGLDGQPISKIRHRDDVMTNVPRSLFDRPSPQLLKMRHDIRMQKYRGIPRPALSSVSTLKTPSSHKPMVPEPDNMPDWLIHEDMSLLQSVSYLELHPNLIVLAPAHTPNWDLVADMVNQVSRVYRSSKNCQARYENVLILREEGKLLYDTSPKKNKTKNKLQIFTKTPQIKAGRAMRTSQLHAQDQNSTFTKLMVSRFDTIRNISNRRTPSTQSSKPLLMNSQSNVNLRNHLEVLHNSKISYEQPLTPIEVAQKLAERIAKEKQATVASRATPEQLALLQQRRAAAAVEQAAQQSNVAQVAAALHAQQQQQQISQQVVQSQTVSSVQQQQVAAVQQIIQQQQQAAAQAQAAAAAAAQQQTQTVVQTQAARQVVTPVRTIQQQQQMAALIQQRTASVAELVRGVPSVVAVSSQGATQIRSTTVTTALVMTSTTQPIVTTRMITGSPATKTLTQSQLQLYKQHQLRQQQIKVIQQRAAANSATSVIQAGQATPTSPVTIRAQAKPRTVTDSEMTAILKRQIQQQQQKAAGSSPTVGTILTQAGQSTGQVATLVKTLPAQTSNVTNIIPQVKTLNAAQIKSGQLRQIQQQILAQRKLTAAATAQGKVVKAGSLPTQLIVQGSGKTIPTTMMQQIQQVIKQQMPHAGTINVSSSGQISHAVITKSPQGTVQQRVIPVSAMSTPKQTIQVVSAGSGIVREHVVRPGTIKVTGTAQQQALFSQVQAAFQQQGQNIQMRSSPVRIQTSHGQPIMGLAVSQAQPLQQMQVQQTQQQNPQIQQVHHQINPPDQT